MLDPLLKTLVLATALTAANLSHAHGGATHAASNAAVVKEQKPWGIAGDAARVTRTIEIRMSDAMRFEPERVQVRLGETVRFVHRNDGAVLHEFVLGTREELQAHAELMRRFPNMEHDEPYMEHVSPGARHEMIWTFNRAGDFDYACLIPGHYEAGMVGHIHVVRSRPATSHPKGNTP
jgi:uncharacterized cupredoxin-like copper-binding protein